MGICVSPTEQVMNWTFLQTFRQIFAPFIECKHKKRRSFQKISNKSVQFFNGLLENKLAIFLFPISWICYVKNFEVWCFSQLRKFDTLTATLRLALFRSLSWILTLKILYTRLITSRLWQHSGTQMESLLRNWSNLETMETILLWPLSFGNVKEQDLILKRAFINHFHPSSMLELIWYCTFLRSFKSP